MDLASMENRKRRTYVFSVRLTLLLERAIAKGRSQFCLSVCPSVTLVTHAYTVQDIETQKRILRHTIGRCF